MNGPYAKNTNVCDFRKSVSPLLAAAALLRRYRVESNDLVRARR